MRGFAPLWISISPKCWILFDDGRGKRVKVLHFYFHKFSFCPQQDETFQRQRARLASKTLISCSFYVMSSWRLSWLKCTYHGRNVALFFPSVMSNKLEKTCSSMHTRLGRHMQSLNVIPNASPHCLNKFVWMSRVTLGGEFARGVSFFWWHFTPCVWQLVSFGICLCVRHHDRQNEHTGVTVPWNQDVFTAIVPQGHCPPHTPSVTVGTHTDGHTFIQSITLTISVRFPLKNLTHHFQWMWTCLFTHWRDRIILCCWQRNVCVCVCFKAFLENNETNQVK